MMDYPLHLGVTEWHFCTRSKTSIGLGSLLMEGIEIQLGFFYQTILLWRQKRNDF